MKRILLVLLAVVLAPAALISPVHAQPDPADSTTALAQVERALLEEDLQRYEQLSRRRSDTISRLAQLYQALDDAVRRGDVTAPGRLSQLMDQVQEAESDRAALLTAERVVVERIETRLRRMALLAKEVKDLEGRQREKVTGALTGTWDLVLLPLGQRGTCVLEQSGALVSGTYTLDGGWTGSLQGTLVNRKVFLVRTDSRLGKSMELEGYLSGGGAQIRGSWLNYELAGGEGGTGQWSAKRRGDEPPEP